MLERNKIVKASFFASSPKQLDFLIEALTRIVGKKNFNYLVPKFYHKSRTYILNADIRIPETLLNYASMIPKESSKDVKGSEEKQ